MRESIGVRAVKANPTVKNPLFPLRYTFKLFKPVARSPAVVPVKMLLHPIPQMFNTFNTFATFHNNQRPRKLASRPIAATQSMCHSDALQIAGAGTCRVSSCSAAKPDAAMRRIRFHLQQPHCYDRPKSQEPRAKSQ